MLEPAKITSEMIVASKHMSSGAIANKARIELVEAGTADLAHCQIDFPAKDADCFAHARDSCCCTR